MNDSVVKTALFKNLFSIFWEDWKTRKPDFNDLRLWWEEAKCRIAEIAIHCSKKLKQGEDFRIREIEELLASLQNEDHVDIVKIESLHHELNQLYVHKSEGARIREKVQWAQEGEMSSKYFHNFEKAHALGKMWTKIKDKDGNIMSGIDNILKTQVEFYQNLFQSESIDEDCLQELLSNVQSKLSESEQVLCEAEFTLDECTKVVGKLKNGKSPGLDGITTAFYKEYWNLIGSDFLDVIKEIV